MADHKAIKAAALEKVRAAAETTSKVTVEEAQSAVEAMVGVYQKRVRLVVRTYPVVACAIFAFGYGVGSGAKWLGGLF